MNGKIGASMRRQTRSRRMLGAALLGLALAFVLGPAADAGAQEIWYAEKFRAGDVPVSVEQLWSRGSLFRSETVINGHPIVNLVSGTRYVIIDRLTANAPLSLRIMKKILLRQMAFRHHMQFDDLDEEVRAVSASEDAREGIAARLQKRPARFRGR